MRSLWLSAFSSLCSAVRCSKSKLAIFVFLFNFFRSSDVARGYMTNSDLEKAVKAFGKRCGNISRIYR